MGNLNLLRGRSWQDVRFEGLRSFDIEIFISPMGSASSPKRLTPEIFEAFAKVEHRPLEGVRSAEVGFFLGARTCNLPRKPCWITSLEPCWKPSPKPSDQNFPKIAGTCRENRPPHLRLQALQYQLGETLQHPGRENSFVGKGV